MVAVNGTIVNVGLAIADGAMELLKQHNLLVVLLAVVGGLAIVSAVFSKVFEGLKYVFYVIAIPVIIILALINKKERKKRIKELGEIKAHLKANPDKWKAITFKILVALFAILIVVIVSLFFKHFINPMVDLSNLNLTNVSNGSI